MVLTINRFAIRKYSFLLFAAALLFASAGLHKVCAQTTVINPTGDGGFENGATFAANGWTVVNGADTNKWYVGTAATPSSGSNSAYIDSLNGTTYGYTRASTPTASSTVHFYRDVTFPAGETNIVLSFKWKAGGESTYDYLTVYSMPTTVTPVVNIPAPSSTSVSAISTSYSGAVVHASPANLNLQSSAYQTQTICLPASYAGTTRRLVFMWSNDNSGGVQPPASIDEISLVTSIPATPANSPTNLSFTPFLQSINGSFSAATGAPSGYLVVVYPTGATPVSPTNGTTYSAGTALGTGKIVSVGSGLTFSATGLSASTSYTFYVYSYINSSCAGPYYKTSAPLTGTQSTLSCSGGLSGTISVGPTGVYSNLTSAIAAMSSTGIAGNLIFELQPTYTSAGETFPVTFPPNSCASATQTITVQPATGATGLSITSANTTATIDFNGATYVTIDGRPGGSGATSQLTIANTATGGSAARLTNEASNNAIKYCTVAGVTTSTTSGVVFFSTTTGVNGNDNNLIDNCDIKDGATTPTNAIYSSGSTGTTAQNNSNNTISNNRISNYFSAGSSSGGVKLESGSTDWTISTNRFFQSASRTHTSSAQHSAIWVANSSSGNNFLITSNIIGYSSAAATGTYTLSGLSSTTLIPIFLSVGSTTPTGVQGNTITAIAQSGTSSGTSSSAPFRGIYVSAGVVNIGNVSGNTIGSLTATGAITYTSSSTSASDVMGMFNFGSDNWNVSNNNIGGISVTNSSTGAANLYGIRFNTSSSANTTVQNNTIGGSIANSLQSTGASTGNQQVVGIFSSTSNATVSGNIIRNLTNAAGTGTTTASSVIGISFAGTSVNNTVSQNTIFNLSNTNTSAATIVTGIQYNATSGTNTVERNFIYGLSLATSSTSGEVNGIRIAGGTTTYRNNMIALGAGVTTSGTISGINEPSGTDNFWHNSIYIGGSPASGSGNSFAFNSTVTSNTRSVRDNIFVNARSNGGTATGKNYAIQVGGTAANPAGLTSNNNIFYITGTGTFLGRFNSLDVVDITAWRAAVGQDANSLQYDPQYNNPTATNPDLHLSATNPTVAEGSGVDMGVLDDFDGQTRAGLTPVDIGADAGNFVALDILPPAITYTPISNTSCVSATTRAFPAVTITDANGINVATGTKPRLYYRKSTDANTYAGNTSSDNGWKYVDASNTTSPFSFTIDYTKLQGGGVSTGDVIQYFVVAQDLAPTPNVGINSGTFAATPSSVALTSVAFPIGGTINSYTIATALSGAVTIGATGTYTSITGTSGLFNAINTQGLTGNLTATIIDASVTESGAVALNSIINSTCAATGTFTVLVKPQTTSTLTGSSTGSIIKLNGADNVTIDGSNNGTTSKNLTITNTNTGTSSSLIWLASTVAGDGATSNTIKNCILTGNASTTTFGCVISSGSVLGGVAEGANNSNTYQNNSMSLAQYGIAVVGPSVMETGTVISGDSVGTAISAIGVRGMFISNQSGAQVTNNAVQNVVTSTNPSSGIMLAGTTNAVNISGNYIANINSTATASGTSSISAIAITAATQTNTTINGNTITGIQSSTTSGYGVRGIIVQGSGTTVSNNMVSDIYNYQDATVTSYATIGISIDGAVTGVKIYHNSVNLFGSHPGYASNTTGGVATCLYINSTTAGGVDVRNNIFTNSYDNSTSTGDKAYAIYSLSANTVFSSINNNDYYVSGTGSPVLGFLGSDLTTLAALQTAFGGNANSISIAPVYTSTTNLHLSNALGANWCLNGTGATIATVTTDIDGQTRSTPPDMGADEFTPTDNTATTPTTQTICSGSAITAIASSGIATSYTWTRNNTATVTGIAASGTGSTISGSLTNTTSAPVTVTFTITPLDANGCALGTTVTATVIVNPIPTVTAAPATQTICTGTAITTIVNSGTVAGTTFAWARDNTATVTGIGATGSGNISGTLTNTTGSSVPVTFTITPTFVNAATTCTGTATTSVVTVTPNNTITLSSAAGTAAQTLCINTAISNIAYTTSGATGATFTGLPAGVTGSWASNTVTISGTPTVSGTFNYTVTLTGGCGTITTTGTITVTPNNTVTLTSAASTASQTLCINTALTNVSYATTGATGATFSGLPAGVTGTWASNVATISGTPTASGTFTYTVTLTGGCGTITTTGTITVTPNNTVTLTSASATTSQTVCINTPLTGITYATTGATGASFTGLPTGVTGTWSGNVVTISGTPTVSGAFSYTVTLTGGCGTITTTGTISVTPNNTVTLSSATGTDAQTRCINNAITNITYATTGATGATFSGLPAGVTGTWSGNVATISGTPTASGTFNYTLTLTGGCGVITAAGTITVNPNNTISLSSAVGTNAQTLCINTPAANITYATTGATGATFSGLPTGIIGTWAGNTATISGTPTVSGTFNYTVTLTGGCGTTTAIGTVTVTPNNTVTLTSAASSTSQAICINTPLTNITYATTGATGATFSGLPAGVTGSWAANVATISGTPTVSGIFGYTVTLTGGCGVITATGTVTVTSANTIALSSATGSNAQTLCINTPVTNITYATTGATGATFSGLPAGVTGTWASNVATISGTPTVSGTFTYTVTPTGGCGSAITATGTITVTPNNTITLSSAAGSNAQTVCINTAITTISYNTTGATGASFAGLPAGVSGVRSGNTITISGTPTVSGTYSYTVTLTGGCGTIAATGTISVTPNNTITLSSAIGTNNQTRCINTPLTNITYTTTTATGATVTGLPAGVTGSFAANTVTISGTPTVTGTFTYTIALTGGCGTVSITGTITVNPNNTIALSSAAGTNAQTRCVNSPITNITYTITSATGATFSGLPAGVNGSFAGNTVTISGTPLVSGTFSYTVTLTGGCGTITASGTITVNPLPAVAISPSTAVSICAGTGATLTASGATSYVWTPATGLNTTTGSVVIASPAASTTYTVTGTDANGCVNTASRLVNVQGLPNITIAASNNGTLCPGTSVTLSANGASSYVWTPSATLSSGTGAVVVATPPVTTTYTVTGTAANGCVNTATRTVNVFPRPSSDITPMGYVNICQYDSVTLSAAPGFVSYQWMIYGSVIAPATSNTLTTGTGGFYTLKVIDANGCSTTTSQPTVVTVIQRPVPVIQQIGTTLSTGAGYVAYQWYRNGVLIPGATGQTYTPVQGGSYTVDVLADMTNNCPGSSQPYIYTAVGVNNTAISLQIKLYPNPASDAVRIESPVAVDVTVTGMDGKIIYTGRDTKELYIGQWADGVYQVVIRDKSGSFLKTEKLTKLSR